MTPTTPTVPKGTPETLGGRDPKRAPGQWGTRKGPQGDRDPKEIPKGLQSYRDPKGTPKRGVGTPNGLQRTSGGRDPKGTRTPKGTGSQRDLKMTGTLKGPQGDRVPKGTSK